MEQMAEQVAGSHYQRLHHMLSESNWSRAEVRQQLIVDANTQFGHGAALVFDESAFAKKGEKSVGVARQWNGRLGKTENSQVGVFAALVRDRACALVDGELSCPSTGLMTQNAAGKRGYRHPWHFGPRVKSPWICCCTCGAMVCITAMSCSMPVTAICRGC